MHSRITRRVLTGSALACGALALSSVPAQAAVTASFSAGTLSVFGDSLPNNIAISRNAAGQILVNGGAVAVIGGTPTVANVGLIQVFGGAGNDTISLSEINGALPRANLFGGTENDTLTTGSGNDQVFGQAGNDTLLGKGGVDFLFGGADDDSLTAGDGDDQSFGESGNDRMIWNPGDDTDLDEGGDGTDTVEVNGGNGAEQFTATANGSRVRFDRVTPAPFALDIGTAENLVLNANGGDDRFSATGNLAALIQMTIDGGIGSDTILGGNGTDVLRGGDGNDFADGNQGADTVFLGAGEDTAQWDPGDASDTVEGQDGADKLLFNGSNISENIELSANGGRVRLTRDIAAIVMDLDDVESVAVKALGGTDKVTVDDLSGTNLVDVATDLAASGGADDGTVDNVVVGGTGGRDAVTITGAGGVAQVTGLAAKVSITGAGGLLDRLRIDGGAGDDAIGASEVLAGAIQLTLEGGEDADALVGGGAIDTILGGGGDDVIAGGPGTDVVDAGLGSDTIVDTTVTTS